MTQGDDMVQVPVVVLKEAEFALGTGATWVPAHLVAELNHAIGTVRRYIPHEFQENPKDECSYCWVKREDHMIAGGQ